MLRLTRKTDYALVALAHLAEADGRGPISARELAEVVKAPRALLTGVLGQLQQAGLLTSKRGVHGGYALSRKPAEMPILEVIRAVEGQIVQLTLCCADGEESDSDDPGCEIVDSCQTRWQIQQLNERLNAVLEDTTLADLLRPAAGSVAAEDRSRSTFEIGG